MNYRHAFHAGNFADVAKHVALVAVLQHLRKKDAAFAVIDSHAGRGAYDLSGDEALRTGEAADGIGRLVGLRSGPPALEAYLDLVRAAGLSTYPGSPLIAATLLRSQDRLLAIEKHPEDAAALAATLKPFRNAEAYAADGYARLTALLPPPQRRGVILIDPPYEAPDEFVLVARAMAGALRRFATGVYLIWFPMKSQSDANGLCGEVLAAGAKKALRIDVRRRGSATDRLGAAGLLIVNPPFGFASEMQAALALTMPLMAGGEARIAWLAGPE
jgi:23S rRNA (adenine2030-N6)-methyltransferase